MRILVFCPNLIGDAVMATPLLRAVRNHFERATIDGVMKPAIAAALEGGPWLDRVIRFDPRSSDRRLHSLPLLRRLRSERYDLAILLPNSFRSALMAKLAGAKERIGYARGGRGRLLSRRLAPPCDQNGRFLPTPAVGYYLQIARALGCRIEATRLELFTSPDDEAAADRVWSDLGLPPGHRVVCFNNGGAFGPAKNWPTASFAQLARGLVASADVSVLVICGPAEREGARAIVTAADHPRVVSLAEHPLGIGLSKACVRRSTLMVTTDSGPRHFAGAFGVPVVSLFGPTHIVWTLTSHPLAVHLQQPVPCGPCQQGHCPLGHHRCMTELSPDAVLAAALRLLSTTRRPWGSHDRESTSCRAG